MFPSTTASEIFRSLQLCEDIVCTHAAGQQFFQHVLCFGFLCGFRCFGFSLDLFGFNSGDFLVDRFQLCLLGFQVGFQRIDVSGDGCDFSGSGFLCRLLFSNLCSKVNGCFYGLGLVLASFVTGRVFPLWPQLFMTGFLIISAGRFC